MFLSGCAHHIRSSLHSILFSPCILIVLYKNVAVVEGYNNNIITASFSNRLGFQHQQQNQPRQGECYSNKHQKYSGFLCCTDNDAVESQTVTSDYRRAFLYSMMVPTAITSTLAMTCSASAAAGTIDDENNKNNPTMLLRQGKDYGYVFQQPPNFRLTRKPLQTHLDELNLEPSSQEGDKKSSLVFGITVDPVRINSLLEFGTPEQVAARIVTADLNRDGVFEVTLDRAESYTVDNGSKAVYYIVDYTSDGKRGRKRFFTRTCIFDQKLYVATAQIKHAEYQEYQLRQKEIEEALKSFVVVGPSATTNSSL